MQSMLFGGVVCTMVWFGIVRYGMQGMQWEQYAAWYGLEEYGMQGYAAGAGQETEAREQH